jgi:hypothetical protein
MTNTFIKGIKTTRFLIGFFCASTCAINLVSAHETNAVNTIQRPRGRIIHQNFSKWDKNHDGKLTGSERQAFLADKAKERFDHSIKGTNRVARPKIKRAPKPPLARQTAPVHGTPKRVE